MSNVKIDIFEMSHEQSVSCFNCLEKLEKIRLTNGPAILPVDNKKSVTTCV
jgi:hypothetical protein